MKTYIAPYNKDIEIMEIKEQVKEPFLILNTYHGNTTEIRFETLEEAIKCADKMQKSRKKSINVFKYECRTITKNLKNGDIYEHNSYKNVYNSKNEELDICRWIF